MRTQCGNIEAAWNQRLQELKLHIPRDAVQINIEIDTMEAKHTIEFDPWQCQSKIKPWTAAFRPAPHTRMNMKKLRAESLERHRSQMHLIQPPFQPYFHIRPRPLNIHTAFSRRERLPFGGYNSSQSRRPRNRSPRKRANSPSQRPRMGNTYPFMRENSHHHRQHTPLCRERATTRNASSSRRSPSLRRSPSPNKSPSPRRSPTPRRSPSPVRNPSPRRSPSPSRARPTPEPSVRRHRISKSTIKEVFAAVNALNEHTQGEDEGAGHISLEYVPKPYTPPSPEYIPSSNSTGYSPVDPPEIPSAESTPRASRPSRKTPLRDPWAQ